MGNEHCADHSGLEATVKAVKETMDRIADKIEKHYPRELVYVIGFLGTALGVVTTLLVERL